MRKIILTELREKVVEKILPVFLVVFCVCSDLGILSVLNKQTLYLVLIYFFYYYTVPLCFIESLKKERKALNLFNRFSYYEFIQVRWILQNKESVIIECSQCIW